MGCDIHSMVEVRDEHGIWHGVKERLFPMSFEWRGQTHTADPFDWRSYGLFGFLADVRNYSYVPYISQARQFPDDLSREARDRFGEDYDFHSRSWLSVSELLAFDYDKQFEDRRTMRDGNGAADAGIGNGTMTTFREFLGSPYFRDLEIMRALDPNPENIRVVFCFDN